MGYVDQDQIRLRGVYVTDYLYHLEDVKDADTISSDVVGTYCPGIAHSVGMSMYVEYSGNQDREYCDLNGWVEPFREIHAGISCGAREMRIVLHRDVGGSLPRVGAGPLATYTRRDTTQSPAYQLRTTGDYPGSPQSTKSRM